MEIYKGIGLMSGTSLDGLDMAYCLFVYDKQWTFTIERTETVEYEKNFREQLRNATHLSSDELSELNSSFGHFLGLHVRKFIDKHGLNPDFIASHGHTVFHKPEKGYSLQVGDGNALAAQTGFPVIYDFRSLDVALGGQGAPLVPIGDKLLFSEYSACLNLGGIANISFDKNGQRQAFDICPVNMVLNYLAEKKGLPYDDQGKMARTGQLIDPLLQKLNTLAYYQQDGPRSLGKEWVVQNVFPLLDSERYQINDLLHTFIQHITFQLMRVIDTLPKGKILISGGGAYNTYCIDLLKQKTSHEIIIPQKTIIDYKEALIFAFLGVLRLRGEVNTLASVTGAATDSCGGVIAGLIPKKVFIIFALSGVIFG